VSVISVSFAGVAKRFAGKLGLTPVSGRLEPGKVLVVVGANGAGKSTLLAILAGLLRPSRGSVDYQDGESSLPREHWFQHIGMAAPDMAVYEELTAIENLHFFAKLRRCQRSTESLHGLLEDMGLDRADHTRPVGGYSSGMKQRVKLAQAVLHVPAVLLLDEPSANLDEAGHHKVAGIVERFRATAAVAVATNDPREMAWADERLELAR
jgi:heme exporter protein A